MNEASQGTILRDFLIFQLKLFLDGLKDMTLSSLSVVALVLDLLRSRGKKPRLFYKVMHLGERFDLWLNLYEASEGADEDADGLFGRSRAGSQTLVGQLEQVLRGGDVPRGKSRGRGGSSPEPGPAAGCTLPRYPSQIPRGVPRATGRPSAGVAPGCGAFRLSPTFRRIPASSFREKGRFAVARTRSTGMP